MNSKVFTLACLWFLVLYAVTFTWTTPGEWWLNLMASGGLVSMGVIITNYLNDTR